MNSLKMAAVMMAAAALCACGGGGGNSGGSSSGSSANGTLSVSTNSLTFIADGPNATTPAPQVVTGSVTGVSSGIVYIAITGTGPAIANVTLPTIANNTGQSTVSVPAPASMGGIGAYTGTITVVACLNDQTCQTGDLAGSPQTIAVNYYVAGLTASVSALNYTITNSSAASALTQQTVITGFPAQSWTATTQAPWLTIPSGGASGATLNAAINQTVLPNMTDGVYTGTITLTPSTGQPLTIPVTLNLNRTEVNYVSPYVGYTGTSNSVVISGNALSQVSVTGILFGSTPALSFTQISPNEYRATYPALAAGRYPIVLQTNYSGVIQRATLVVVDPPTFTAAALAMPSADNQQAYGLVYDAERATVAVDTWHFNGDTGLVRFTWNGSAWQAPTEFDALNMFGIALTADGTQWIVGSNFNVLHLDANDLSTVATVATPLSANGLQTSSYMAVASDGSISILGNYLLGCGSQYMVYNPSQQAFTTPSYTACRGFAGASADGSLLLVGSQSSSIGTNDVFQYNLSSVSLATTGVFQFINSPPVIDRQGDLFVLANTQVYNASDTLLGTLPTTTQAVTLSPDGTRAYTFDQANTLRTFDLTSPTGGTFTEVGTGIALAGNPNPSITSTQVGPFMTITPDGKTVFITGGGALVVQPTPP